MSGSGPSLRPAAIAARLRAAAIAARLRAAGCVFAEEEARLLIAAAPAPADLEAMIERRIGGLPLEYVIGWAEFCGLHISIDPGVFVPRHRSEFLVSQAAARAVAAAVVLDLCCGSGALGVALAAAVGPIELHAADMDPAAVRCAQRNLAAIGGHVYHGDLFDPLPPSLRGRVDVLIANVPYVPTDEIALLPREARLYEPEAALNGGADGLDLARRVAAGAPLWLAPGGHLLIETGDHQADATAGIFADSGLVPEVTRLDELDATVVTGAMRAAPTR